MNLSRGNNIFTGEVQPKEVVGKIEKSHIGVNRVLESSSYECGNLSFMFVHNGLNSFVPTVEAGRHLNKIRKRTLTTRRRGKIR